MVGALDPAVAAGNGAGVPAGHLTRCGNHDLATNGHPRSCHGRRNRYRESHCRISPGRCAAATRPHPNRGYRRNREMGRNRGTHRPAWAHFPTCSSVRYRGPCRPSTLSRLPGRNLRDDRVLPVVPNHPSGSSRRNAAIPLGRCSRQACPHLHSGQRFRSDCCRRAEAGWDSAVNPLTMPRLRSETSLRSEASRRIARRRRNGTNRPTEGHQPSGNCRRTGTSHRDAARCRTRTPCRTPTRRQNETRQTRTLHQNGAHLNGAHLNGADHRSGPCQPSERLHRYDQHRPNDHSHRGARHRPSRHRPSGHRQLACRLRRHVPRHRRRAKRPDHRRAVLRTRLAASIRPPYLPLRNSTHRAYRLRARGRSQISGRPRSRQALGSGVCTAKCAEGHNLTVTALSGKDVRRRPTLPRSLPRSTIGAEGLNFRVRNGTGCFPFAMATETLWRCDSPG